MPFFPKITNHFFLLGVFICLFFLSIHDAEAQKRKTKDEINFEELVEEYFPMPEDDVDYSDAYEVLFQLLAEPIDLNNTTREELKMLFILSNIHIDALFEYKEKHGDLLSIYELQAISGFTVPFIQKILPFVTVRETNLEKDNTSLFQRLLREKNNFLLLRYDNNLQEKAGFKHTDSTQAKYLGSPEKLYARYRVSHTNDFSFGFTAEKDQGEQLVFDPKTHRYFADFLSAHLVMYNQGKIKSFAIGDFLMQFGQSLVFGGGFGIGKGSETITSVRRNSFGVRPYTSVVEGNFFRGGAMTYKIGRFELTGLYSSKRKDASVNIAGDTLTEDEDYISAIQITGFHRTEREIASKGGLLEQNIGANLTYNSAKRNLQLGLNALNTHFSLPFIRNESKYNQFEFNGTNNLLLGGFWDYNFRNFSFFGEAARSESGGTGLVTGLLANLSQTVEMSFLYRNYAKNFHTFYGRGFSENSRSINEEGTYWGLKIRPNRRWMLTAYFDYFKFPWLRFLVDAPSEGHEYLARLTYTPTKKITLFAHFREESRKRNFSEGTFNQIAPYTKRNYQLNCDYRAEKILHLRARVQFSSFEQNNVTTSGFAFVQDANFDFGNFRIGTRFAIFDTDDYDNRQYIFEKDVLYVFYIPAYYGRGYRNYYLLQFRPTKNIDVWVKYALTRYEGQTQISAGYEAIEGNLKSDIRIQMRYTFR